MSEALPSAKLLYHYCSADTFFSILKSRSIWLSSLALANDSMEGRLVTSQIMNHAQEHAGRGGISAERIDALRQSLHFMDEYIEGLAFCVSEEGDLLSQWRGYADEARGFAIGFSVEYLNALVKAPDKTSQGTSLVQVNYDSSPDESLTARLYEEFVIDALKSTSESAFPDDNNVPAQAGMVMKLMDLVRHLYTFKGQAFREEKEWRILSTLWPVLADTFGGPSTSFRCTSGKIIPYLRRSIDDVGGLAAIGEICLGPRNPTPLKIVERFVSHCGYTAPVVASAATYR